MKKFFSAAVAMLCAVSAWAEPIVLNQRSDWSKNNGMKITADGIMEFSGKRVDIFSTPFKVDPAKTYKFSMEVRTKPGTTAGLLYIGNWSMTDKNLRVLPEYILTVPQSDTVLLEDAAAGSTTVVIAKPACWNEKSPHRTWSLALDARADRSDLPNSQTFGILKGIADGDKVTLTLKKPLNKALAAGSPVRFHFGSSGMYGGLNNKRVGEEWQLVTWTVSGYGKAGSNPANKWWHGTSKGAIRIIANYKYDKNAVLQVRNVTMEVVD